MAKQKDRLMPKSLYQMQYFFEATCEYVYDMHFADYDDIMSKIFPDNTLDIKKKKEYLDNGQRSIFQQPFTTQDAEMEQFIQNAIKP